MLISNLNLLPMFKQGSTITDTRVVAAVRDAMLLQLVLRQLSYCVVSLTDCVY